MESTNGNGSEGTEIWKWKRESESGNGNEASDVTMGMEKRNIDTFQKRLKFNMKASLRVRKKHHSVSTFFNDFALIFHMFSIGFSKVFTDF